MYVPSKSGPSADAMTGGRTASTSLGVVPSRRSTYVSALTLNQLWNCRSLTNPSVWLKGRSTSNCTLEVIGGSAATAATVNVRSSSPSRIVSDCPTGSSSPK